MTPARYQHPSNVKLVYVSVCAAILSACTVTTLAVNSNFSHSDTAPLLNCSARETSTDIDWRVGDRDDSVQLARWCRAVGTPVFTSTAAADAPSLDELVAISWNAHLAEGDLPKLIDALKSGALTNGRPVQHFVLLIQELYRRGDAVPAFDIRDRTAFAIKARDPESLDVDDYAAELGLSILYVPAMRNGAALREDRGNAIVSSEPLLDPIALELPLARQRRVTVAAAINVRTPDGVRPLQVVDAHLEPLSSPKTGWVFKNPRPHQVGAILEMLDQPRFTDPANAGVVLGGDFNTVRSGAREKTYHLARAWSTSLRTEDPRDTHMMGRLDYLFAKLDSGWTISTRRLDDRFGSDHHPVIATFAR